MGQQRCKAGSHRVKTTGPALEIVSEISSKTRLGARQGVCGDCWEKWKADMDRKLNEKGIDMNQKTYDVDGSSMRSSQDSFSPGLKASVIERREAEQRANEREVSGDTL